MIPRGSPYISWSDLAWALFHAADPREHNDTPDCVARMWAPNTVAFLSVRSGFDALLRTLACPTGSEIVMSAVTIPHLLDIVAHHGLVAVPVDIDLDTLGVSSDDVRTAIGPRTRAIMVAHLFGSRMPLDGIAAVAREFGLPLIEDCAQANDGSGYRGHPDAAVSMFSFGPIKRQTALGGALLRFADPDLATGVRRIQQSYPTYPRGKYLRRILTMTAVKAVSMRPLFSAFVALCRATGRDHDRTLGLALRGFSRGDLLSNIRQRPSSAMLRTLERRLRTSGASAVERRVALVEETIRTYPEMARPGRSAQHHTHWLFPMLARDPQELMTGLWAKGYDATRGASNLVHVPFPAGNRNPERARRMMSDIVYLPVSLSATKHDMRCLAGTIRELNGG